MAAVDCIIERFAAMGPYDWGRADCLTMTAAFVEAGGCCIKPEEYVRMQQLSSPRAIVQAEAEYGTVGKAYAAVLEDLGIKEVPSPAARPGDLLIIEPLNDMPSIIGFLGSDYLIRLWTPEGLRLWREVFKVPAPPADRTFRCLPS